jgi:hypothetical protein
MGLNFVNYEYSETLDIGYDAKLMHSQPVELRTKESLGIMFVNVVYWNLITIHPDGGLINEITNFITSNNTKYYKFLNF